MNIFSKISYNFNQNGPNNQKSSADSKSIYINRSLETTLAKLGDTFKRWKQFGFWKIEKSDLIGQNPYSFCYVKTDGFW